MCNGMFSGAVVRAVPRVPAAGRGRGRGGGRGGGDGGAAPALPHAHAPGPLRAAPRHAHAAPPRRAHTPTAAPAERSNTKLIIVTF